MTLPSGLWAADLVDFSDTPAVFIVLAVLLGLTFGSFSTVVAWRLPRGESVVGGRSKCPQCGNTISALENIPVVSYLLQRGRCRNCGTRISPRYPFIEASTGVLFALAVWAFGLHFEAIVYAAFFWALVVLTVIDIEHKLLPNRIVFPAFIAGWIGLFVAALIRDDFDPLADAGLGALIFGGLLFVVAFIAPAGMGMGDVKLAFVLGTFLGYAAGPGVVLVGMFLSFMLGAVIGSILAFAAGGNRKTRIPFGPYLAAGSTIAIFIGRDILDWYLGIV